MCVYSSWKEKVYLSSLTKMYHVFGHGTMVVLKYLGWPCIVFSTVHEYGNHTVPWYSTRYCCITIRYHSTSTVLFCKGWVCWSLGQCNYSCLDLLTGEVAYSIQVAKIRSFNTVIARCIRLQSNIFYPCTMLLILLYKWYFKTSHLGYNRTKNFRQSW